MKVETKFSIGDKVYSIHLHPICGWVVSLESDVITAISTQTVQPRPDTNTLIMHIKVFIKHIFFINTDRREKTKCFGETCVFFTREEAREEAQERNVFNRRLLHSRRNCQ